MIAEAASDLAADETEAARPNQSDELATLRADLDQAVRRLEMMAAIVAEQARLNGMLIAEMRAMKQAVGEMAGGRHVDAG